MNWRFFFPHAKRAIILYVHNNQMPSDSQLVSEQAH